MPTPVRIDTVTISGSEAAPEFVVAGSGLRTQPQPSPDTPAAEGDSGYDYGESFFIQDVSRAQTAGEWDGKSTAPSARDVIGIVFNSYSDSNIGFTVG